MNDRPFYQNMEADKWFEKYIATIKERDSIRSALLAAKEWLEAVDAFKQAEDDEENDFYIVDDLETAVDTSCKKFRAKLKEGGL